MSILFDSLAVPSRPIPQHLDVYRIVRPLNRGGMSDVLLAERTCDFQQQVVIKFCPTTFAQASSEGSILGRLKHQNIVQLLGGGTSEYGDYLVLEYVEGTALDEFCRTNKCSLRTRLNLLNQAMSAVAYAHRHLVIHADIKPSNVLVTTDEDGVPCVKVLDFGIAQNLDGNPQDQNFYTPLYASPEQKQGKAVSVLTDVYSLGLLCSNLLGDSLRGDLRATVRKALQVSPEDRYGSVEAMRDDLKRAADGLPTSVRPVSAPEAAFRWLRRRPLVAAMLILLAAVTSISAANIVVHHARIVEQRRLADQQLTEAIQLTGVLQGELYGALDSLGGSQSARKHLRETASQTLDSLAPNATNATLRIELAKQYGRLAELDAVDASDPSAHQHKDDDVQRGLAILGNTGNRDASETRRYLERLRNQSQ